jgi:DNA-binding response OmpR family regulator
MITSRYGDIMGKDIKILIVEDNMELVKILNMQLAQEGFEVAYAEDAVQAVSTAQQERPNLILLDIGLPGGDGFVVMERLSKLNTTKLIPIIIITGQDKAQAKQQALQAGVAGYLVKPIEFEILLAQIQKALGIKTDAPTQPAAPQPAPPQPEAQKTEEQAPSKKAPKEKASSDWKDLIKRY